MKRIQIIRVLLLLFVSIIILFSCSKDQKTAILFVPGYGSEKSMWNEYGLLDSLRTQGLIYGGNVSYTQINIDKSQKNNYKNANFYVCTFTDSIGTVNSLCDELTEIIKMLKEKTNNQNFILVSYSMGGIISRNYLTKNLSNHSVKTLITIASPHNGSYLSNFVYGTVLLFGGSNSQMSKYFTKILQSINPIDYKTIKDFIVSGEDSFLSELNQRKHPNDVSYVSVVCKMSDFSENVWLSRLLSDENIEEFNDRLDILGDGLASINSQNMENISYFTENQTLLKHQSVTITANHLNALSNTSMLIKIIKNVYQKY